MIIWIIAGIISGFIKGLCGVGDAPVFSSIMSFSANNIDISPVILPPSFMSNTIIAWKNRHSLQKKIWVPMALLLVAGSIPGTLLLKNVDTGVLKLAFGIFITFIGVIMLYNEIGQKKIKPSKMLLVTIGVLSGLSSGLFGVGVLLVVYIRMTTDDMSSFKGNICAIFLTENFARIVMYLILGLFTAPVLKNVALVTPFIAAGLFLGHKASSFLDERKAKITVMAMLIVSGIAIVISNI
jgi:hypothetical protein